MTNSWEKYASDTDFDIVDLKVCIKIKLFQLQLVPQPFGY